MDLCPLCLENNEHSFLVNIGVDTKLLVCESDGCIYLRNEDESTFTDNNINNLSNDNNLKLIYSDSSDLECDLSTTDSDSEYSFFTKKSKLNFSKYKIMPVQRHLSQLIKEANKKDSIFNWFGFPLMLKFHVKMCYFLVIHLHLFNTKKHQIYEVKELYYQCESMVCELPNKLVSLISYKFVKFLYDQHQMFKLANFTTLDMSERILKSMNNFISAMNDSNIYKSVYNFSESCQCCGYAFSYLKEDFTIKVMDDFEYSNYTFKYLTKCRKCFSSKMLQVIIKIERLSNFIFIVCPEGVNKTIAQLNEVILEKPFHYNLKLQAIVELKCPASFGDVPEKEPKFEEFIMKYACKPKVEFRVHFKNTVGWYRVDTNSGICIDPINESDIKISPNKVRFLVYGEPNNPNNFHANEFYSPIYKVLEQFKKSPKGFVKYPSEVIKYWMILFKYRDYCLQKTEYSKSFLNKMSTKITARLNSHLKRRQSRIKKKLKEAMNDDRKVSFSSSDEESVAVDNQFNEEIHDEITWNGIKSSEDLVKPDEGDLDSENHAKFGSNSEPPNIVSNCPAIKGNIKQEAINQMNKFSQDSRTIFSVLKSKAEAVISNQKERNGTNILLDELIVMKKRKLDERNEDLYNC